MHQGCTLRPFWSHLRPNLGKSDHFILSCWPMASVIFYFWSPVNNNQMHSVWIKWIINKSVTLWHTFSNRRAIINRGTMVSWQSILLFFKANQLATIFKILVARGQCPYFSCVHGWLLLSLSLIIDQIAIRRGEVTNVGSCASSNSSHNFLR